MLPVSLDELNQFGIHHCTKRKIDGKLWKTFKTASDVYIIRGGCPSKLNQWLDFMNMRGDGGGGRLNRPLLLIDCRQKQSEDIWQLCTVVEEIIISGYQDKRLVDVRHGGGGLMVWLV